MQFLNQKKGFLGFDAKFKIKDQVIIVPFGLEKTVSYGGGTKNAPTQIIKASHQVELFDEEFMKEPYKSIGIKIKNNLHSALEQLSKINSIILSEKKFPLILGGEHSITPASLKPFINKFEEIVLLHFDAHADLRQEYQGEKFSHASAIRRCLDYKNVKVISLGIRNLSEEEMTFYKNNKDRIEIFWAAEKDKWNLELLKRKLVKKNVYITFDVDCFDSSIMPATGTPEPGGLYWNEVLKIIKSICSVSNIIGADINELAPIKNFDSYDFLIAKLTYKILTYIFEFKS